MPYPAGGPLAASAPLQDVGSGRAPVATHSPRLKLADLTQPVIHLGCTAQVLTDLNYLAPNLWSLALQQHPANVDGIYFRSRYANAESVAIFDRVPLVQTSPSLELLNASEMGNFLSHYNIGLI
ncbi:MAG: hypothetical protein V4578_07880 [Pseudomonadota bacterium]